MDTPNKTHTYSELNKLYGKAYFSGKTSGYGPGGYKKAHTSWLPMLKAVKDHNPDACWLDVGCAYGYLIEEAQTLGLKAFGMDVSRFALQQLKAARQNLLGGEAEALPLLSSSMDVISLFDIIEHLPHPVVALKEAKRVLKPQGILLITTPDPINFEGEEESHCYERPPSDWVQKLINLGMDVEIGFGGLEYEITVAATPSPASQETRNLMWSLASIRQTTDVHLACKGKNCWTAFRGHWPDSSSILSPGETYGIYLLIGGTSPQKVTLELASTSPRPLQASIDDLCLRCRKSTCDTGIYSHIYEPVTVWPGGHRLQLYKPKEAVPVKSEECGVNEIMVKGAPLNKESERRRLPFDQFQRYKHVTDILNALGHLDAKDSILEVGAKRSRLTAFLPETADYTGTDMEWDDVPHFFAGDGTNINLTDQTADVVIAVDVFEHIPPDKRQAFLEEMLRLAGKTVIIAGPFDTPHAAACDALVERFRASRGIGKHEYLDEHLQFGLPNMDETGEFFAGADCTVAILPNGHVGWWALGQILSYGMDVSSDLHPGCEALQELLTRPWEDGDHREPAYRHALVASRKSLTQTQIEKLRALVQVQETPEKHVDPLAFAGPLIQVFGLDAIRERESIIADRDQRIQKLLDHIAELAEERKKQQTFIEQLQAHEKNLEKNIQELTKELASRGLHAENLTDLLKQAEAANAEQIRHNQNLESQVKAADERHDRMADHIQNLETELKSSSERQNQLLEHSQNLENNLRQTLEHQKGLSSHISNLETALKSANERRDQLSLHASNLEAEHKAALKHQSELEKHALNLEHQRSEMQVHANNLEEMLKQERKNAQQQAENARKDLEASQSELAELRSHWYVKFGRRMGGSA